METRLRLAEIDLLVRHDTLALKRHCRHYLMADAGQVEETTMPTVISLTSEMRAAEKTAHSVGHAESLALLRAFCASALPYEVLLFHSSAIGVDGSAYLFAARSGVGKSTHTALWRQLLGDRAIMINDDKPFLRRHANGEWYAYGSPWNGKHHLDTPIGMPIRGICLIGRGKTNVIRRVSASEGFARLLVQTHRPTNKSEMQKTTALVADLAQKIPLWELSCTISEEAAILSMEAMVGGLT